MCTRSISSIPGRSLVAALLAAMMVLLGPFGALRRAGASPAIPPTVQFAHAVFHATETDGNTVIELTRTGDLSQPSSMPFDAQGDTGDGSPDHVVSGNAQFAAGQGTFSIEIGILDDGVSDNGTTQSVQLELGRSGYPGTSPPVNATPGSPSTATLFIADPYPVVQFVQSNVAADERDGIVTLTVTRTGDTGTTAQVNFATANGTATSPEDYDATSGSVVFQAGDTQKSFNVFLHDDGSADDGAPHSFTVTLSAPSTATIGTIKTATVTIADQPPPVVQFSASSFPAVEGNHTVMVTISRSGDTSHPSQVVFDTLSGGTAVAFTDYTPSETTVMFPAGITTEQVPVVIKDDGSADDGASDTVNMGLTASGAGTEVLGPKATATLAIQDPLAPPTIQFATAKMTVQEKSGSATLTVTRTGDTSGTSTIDYKSVDITATSPADFTAVAGTLTFTAGQTSHTIVVPLVDDGTGDDGQSPLFAVNLSNPTGATFGAPAGIQVTIADPTPPVVAFNPSSFSTTDTAGSKTITVSRTGDSTGTSSVNYSTVDNSAVAGTDYNATSGTLTFGPGETVKSFAVQILNDGTSDDGTNENLVLVLSNPVGTSLSGIPTAVLTIADPAKPSVQFGSGDLTVAEGAGSVTANVTRTGDTSGTSTVNYATSAGGTPTDDFTATSGTLTFTAGQTTKPITVPILDDGAGDDGNQTAFTINLTNPTNAVVGTPSGVLVHITDPVPAVPPTVQFSTGSFSTTEKAGQATITVTRSGSTSGASSVTYTVSDPSGHGGTAVSGTVSFAAGQISKTFTVVITDDGPIDDGTTETLNLALSAPSGATLGSPNTAVLTITD